MVRNYEGAASFFRNNNKPVLIKRWGRVCCCYGLLSPVALVTATKMAQRAEGVL